MIIYTWSSKIYYLLNCTRFCHLIYSIYRGGFRPYMQQISIEYLVLFENYIAFYVNR